MYEPDPSDFQHSSIATGQAPWVVEQPEITKLQMVVTERCCTECYRLVARLLKPSARKRMAAARPSKQLQRQRLSAATEA